MPYTRRLELLLGRAGLDINPENRRFLDRAVRKTLEMERVDEKDVEKEVEKVMNSDKKQEFEQKIINLLVSY